MNNLSRQSIAEEGENEEETLSVHRKDSAATQEDDAFKSETEGFTSPRLLSRLRHIDSEVDDVSFEMLAHMY